MGVELVEWVVQQVFGMEQSIIFVHIRQQQPHQHLCTYMLLLDVGILLNIINFTWEDNFIKAHTTWCSNIIKQWVVGGVVLTEWCGEEAIGLLEVATARQTLHPQELNELCKRQPGASPSPGMEGLFVGEEAIGVQCHCCCGFGMNPIKREDLGV